jgi:hypothetical protein
VAQKRNGFREARFWMASGWLTIRALERAREK